LNRRHGLDPNLESLGDVAHPSEITSEEISHAKRPRETNARGNRSDGAECHATDAGKSPADARGHAKETREEEIEITEEMIWAGLTVWFDRDREWDDPADIVRQIFASMRTRELEVLSGSRDPRSEPLQSPFRSPIGASSNLRR
jgi:hypothetical protein